MPIGKCVHPRLRQTHQTTPLRMRSLRTRSLRARSPDHVPLPASGPFDPGPIPSVGPPRPWNRLPQPVAWAAQGGSPLPPACHPAGHPGAKCAFICASASFPAASTGIFSYCPNRPPTPPPGQSAPPGPSPIARRARQAAGGRVLLLAVAAHVAPPLPAAPVDGALNRQCLQALLAGCPHAELTKNHVCARKRLRLWLLHLCATHTEDTTG